MAFPYTYMYRCVLQLLRCMVAHRHSFEPPSSLQNSSVPQDFDPSFNISIRNAVDHCVGATGEFKSRANAFFNNLLSLSHCYHCVGTNGEFKSNAAAFLF